MSDVRIKDIGTGIDKYRPLTGEEVGSNGVRAAHVIQVDEDGNIVGGTDNPQKVVLYDPATGDLITPTPTSTDVTFHTAANAAGDGTVFECDGEYSKLVIEITTVDADTQEIDFLGSVEGTNYYPLLGVKIGTDGTVTPAVKTTAIVSEMWEIDITNRKYVKMDLVTLTGAGATVTVTGVVS